MTHAAKQRDDINECGMKQNAGLMTLQRTGNFA
jgi:hypothetical protein